MARFRGGGVLVTGHGEKVESKEEGDEYLYDKPKNRRGT